MPPGGPVTVRTRSTARPGPGPAQKVPGLSISTRIRRLTPGVRTPAGDGPATADTPPGPRPQWRRVLGRTVTGLAALLVFAALVVPDELAVLTPAAFLRIPVEALVVTGLVLLLPSRTGRVLAAVLGGLLGLLTVLTALDMGFVAALDRPFDVLEDWALLGNAVDLLAGSTGEAGATAAAVGLAVLAAAVVVLLALSGVRLAGLVGRHRQPATRTIAVLTVGWLGLALVGVQLVPGVPVAAGAATGVAVDRLRQVDDGLRDRAAFAEAVRVDEFRDVPGEELLTALRGKDVVITFVESYGRSALEDPEYAGEIGALLDGGTARLDAAGFASRSGFLTAPTAGGGSWLSHATLLSGLWVNSEARYKALVETDRLTLNRAFQRAQWRTLGVMPGVTMEWPEGEFYGYDRVYDTHSMGYRGPNFGWAPIPDQYTLAAFERLERSVPDRAPLMAEIPLVASHWPWAPLPEMVGWQELGDGHVLWSQLEGGNSVEEVWADPAWVRTEYRRSIEYSLESVISYVQTYGDDDLVMIVLGDHQPTPVITGEDASRDVPITVISRDPAVLERIGGWGWEDGLKPGPQAPVWPMDAFRDRFLSTFSDRGEPPEPH